MSSLDFLDGVDCLLGPFVNLLMEGTGLGELMEPHIPDADGFLGFCFLVGLNDHNVVLRDVQCKSG